LPLLFLYLCANIFFMSLRNYLTSKVFFMQMLIAISIVLLLGYLFFHWLTYVTDHNEEIMVPNLKNLSELEVEEKLDDLNLEYVLLDSVDFDKRFKKHCVVEQDPIAGAKVKEGRKIYIKINSSGFKTVQIPNLIEKTYRQAVPTLKSIGLEEGKITYKPYLGKDMVLEMYLNGKKLKPGDKVFKSSKIDLVLGDGNVGFDDTELVDSLSTPAIEETPVDGQ
jgi:beta-lactam-binding protein with PASTA domain